MERTNCFCWNLDSTKAHIATLLLRRPEPAIEAPNDFYIDLGVYIYIPKPNNIGTPAIDFKSTFKFI